MILVIIAVASVGSFQVWNRPIWESATSVYSTTSFPTTISSSTLQTSISSTSIYYPPTQWISIRKLQTLGYYESLLVRNGTQPYQLLGEQLRQLPDITNASAVAQVAYLALNATNPEVKEAFTLMMQGGTSNPNDFQYPIPSYNTELEVLYWLACQNQFKRDDTLALAIAMDNGIWVTMGDKEVIASVRNDTINLLTFLRETNQLQEQEGYYPLESYPLEAKIVLGWTGGESPDAAKSHALSLFLGKQLDLKSYHWDFTSVDTYRNMQAFMMNPNSSIPLLSKSALWTLHDLNVYFQYNGPHWVYTLHGGPSQTVVVDGESMSNWEYGSTNYCFSRFLSTGIVYGVSYDHLPFIDSLLKSVGIASTHVYLTSAHTPSNQSLNDFNIVYVPETRVWVGDPSVIMNGASEGTKWVPGAVNESHLVLFKPPVDQAEYLTGMAQDRIKEDHCPDVDFCDMIYPEYSNAYTSILGTSYEKGIPFNTMKADVTGGMPTLSFKIDGYGRDWVNFTAIMSKGPTNSVPGKDLEALYAVADASYLYVMIKLYGPPDPSNKYIFPLDLTGTGKWDYSIGFSNNSVWMYNLQGIPNNQWPDSRLSTPDAIYAVGAVAEIAIPLQDIGNPTKITIADLWLNSPNVTVDDFGTSASVSFIIGPTTTNSGGIPTLQMKQWLLYSGPTSRVY